MKKQLFKRISTAFLAFVMVFVMIPAVSLPVFAWSWKDDAKFEVAAYDTPIVEDGSIKLDAELDSAYLAGTKITSYPDEEPYFRSGAYESLRGKGDASFYAYTAVDTTGLFVYAEIADTTIFPTTNTNGNDGDFFQLYFDWCTPDIVHPSPEDLYDLYLIDGTGWNYREYKSRYGVTGLQYIGWVSGDYNGVLTGASGFSPTTSLGPAATDKVILETKLVDGGWVCEWFIPWRDQEQKDMIASGEQFHCGVGFLASDDADIDDTCTPGREENCCIKFDQRKELGLSYWADYSMLADLVWAEDPAECSHSYVDGACTLCGAACEHKDMDGDTCSDCGQVVAGIILGDANDDGEVNNADALAIFKYIFNSELYPIPNFKQADTNCDGDITNEDALAVFKYIYNPTLFPVVDPNAAFDDVLKELIEDKDKVMEGEPSIDTSIADLPSWKVSDLDGYSIMSGNAGKHGTKSPLMFNVVLKEDTILKFDLKVDAAEGDVFYIAENGTRLGTDDYGAGEHSFTALLAPGTHRISLIYEKDSSGSTGADAAYVSNITLEKAGAEDMPRHLSMSLEQPATFDWANATTVEVEDAATILQGAYKSNIDDRNFVYIKKSHNYPKVVVPFTISESGTYDFIFSVCAKRRAEGIISNGLVQIDNGPMYYVGSEHGNRNGILEYFSGVTETLTAGEHTVTFYLAPDFDDVTVRSIYFDQIVYSKTAFEVDGVKGDVEYANAAEYIIGDKWAGTSADYTGTGAKAWVSNNADGLYIYAEVDDKTPTGDTDGNGDNGDKLQVYVDFVRDFEELGLTAGKYKNTGKAGSQRLGWVNVTPDGQIWGGWGFRDVAGLKSKVNMTEDGYTLEMFIPWKAENLPEDGKVGLAFTFHDDINADQNRDAIFFQTGGTDYWNSYEALPTYTLK